MTAEGIDMVAHIFKELACENFKEIHLVKLKGEISLKVVDEDGTEYELREKFK